MLVAKRMHPVDFFVVTAQMRDALAAITRYAYTWILIPTFIKISHYMYKVCRGVLQIPRSKDIPSRIISGLDSGKCVFITVAMMTGLTCRTSR